MTKKGGIRFNEHDQVNIPIFGDQEIEIPEFLAEKTKKGYQLVPTLTKSGSITKRHKEPSIKLTPKNIEYFSIPKNGVERLQLADFVKKSKIELEKQYKVYSDFQNKLLEIELKNVLKIPEVKKTIAEAKNKEKSIEEIKEVLAEEIFGDVPEPTVKKTVSKSEIPIEKLRKYVVDELNTKEKKKSLVKRLKQAAGSKKYFENVFKTRLPRPVSKYVLQSELVDELKTKFSKKPINRPLSGYDDKIHNIDAIMESIVYIEKPMMFKRAEKLYHSGKIDSRMKNAVHAYVLDDSLYSTTRFPELVAGSGDYLYVKEGIISKSTINKYDKLRKEQSKLYADLKAKKEKLAERRNK